MIGKLSIACAIILLLASLAACVPSPDTVVIVDGKKMDLTYPLKLRPGDALVWVGDLVKFGWVSIESQDKERISLKHAAVSLAFTVGKPEASINNLTIEASTVPEIVSGRLYVPLAFTCRSLGFTYGVREALVIESNTTEPADRPAKAGGNSIKGAVLYNGHPIAGIKVRAVTDQNAFVVGCSATTNESGEYILAGLPDGVYKPFIYVADNREFFNRSGDLASLSNGAVCKAKPFNLGRILTAESPAPGSTVSLKEKMLKLRWSECPEAVRYRVTVEDVLSGTTVYDRTVTKPVAAVPVTLLSRGKTYRWSVSARGSGKGPIGASPSSGKALWTFTVGKTR